MIVRLTGTLVSVDEESVLLERDGIGREILVPPFSIGELAASRGREVTLSTIEFIEGSTSGGNFTPRLLGFLHAEDRVFFSRFVGVKGIGPRKAMRALTMPVRRIATWIESADVKSLSGLAGIGPRAADLIVATLRGKVADLAMPADDQPEPSAVVLSDAQRDALEVLIAWGDARNDACRWIERAAQLHPELDTPDEWVRVAYRIKTGVEG